MTPNDLLIRKTAVKANVAESTVDKIISFMWRSVFEHMISKDTNIIEVSNLFVIKALPHRFEKEIDKNVVKYVIHEGEDIQAEYGRRLKILISKIRKYGEEKLFKRIEELEKDIDRTGKYYVSEEERREILKKEKEDMPK